MLGWAEGPAGATVAGVDIHWRPDPLVVGRLQSEHHVDVVGLDGGVAQHNGRGWCDGEGRHAPLDVV